jgi:predicted adenylyl cyclase CyaB
MNRMNRNIEIKARIADPARLEALLRERGAAPRSLSQRDTFFRCAAGRLKLREEGAGAELIYYSRSSDAGARESRYWRCPVSDAPATIALLGAALGIDGVVRKERLLFQIGQTRVHLDAVAGLGDYMELEVVLSESQTAEDGRRIAEALMQELGIRQSELVGPAYIELLREARPDA